MDAGPRSLRVEKRNRPPVSCEPCRARKSKCNRALPCDSCIKRKQSSSCQYAPNVRRGEASHSKKTNLADRLKSLEALVSSFATQDLVVQQRRREGDSLTSNEPLGLTPASSSTASNSTTKGRSQDGLSPETPRIRQSDDGPVNYVESSHWLSILEDIREVREHLSPEGGSVKPQAMASTSAAASWEPEPPGSRVSSVLGLEANLNLDEILTSLPPRPMCDRLLSHYFNSRFQNLSIIHPFEFQKQYESFWEAPSKAPVLWTALLFSVLGIAGTLLVLARPHERDSLPPVKTFQQRTAECLILGQFATANAHALEALLLNLQSRVFTEGHSSRAQVHLWFEMGTIIRLAIRMGYHRDPSGMPGIIPFDAEMRRRVWVNIFQIDALTSFHMGFPSMIPTESCDALPPHNLEFSDLRPDMPTLPPPRPLTDDTPILYIIAKASVMATFKKIVAHTQSLSNTTSTTHYRTTPLDLEARDVYSRIPPHLQRLPVSRSSLLDTPTRILERCNIELLHLKSLVILHRRFVSYDAALNNNTPPSVEASRRACAEAALDMLARQADLYEASQPGGRLYEERWMLASLMVGDFLLAAMVLCLELSVRLRGDKTGGMGTAADEIAGRAYRALRTSRDVWTATGSGSPAQSALATGANTAVVALGLMLRKVEERNPGFLTAQQDVSVSSSPRQSTMEFVSDLESMPVNWELPYADLMSDVIDGAMTPDWNLFDQYFQNPTMESADDASAWNGGPGFTSQSLGLE